MTASHSVLKLPVPQPFFSWPPLPCPQLIVVVMFTIQPSSRQFPIDLVLLLFRELDTHMYIGLEL